MMSGESLFDIVDKSLKKKLEFYKLLDEDGAIGTKTGVTDHQGIKFDFYFNDPDGGKKIPTSPTKEFLQGGLVSSFAVFEWFLQEILFEFGRAIILHNGTVTVTDEELRKTIKLSSPRLWCFKVAFRQVIETTVNGAFEANKNFELLKSFDDGHVGDVGKTDRAAAAFQFYYPLANKKYSKIGLQNVEELDCILNLWYAMRIIVAHGNVSTAFKGRTGAFKKFISVLKSAEGSARLKKIHAGLNFAHFLHYSNKVEVAPKLNLDHPTHLEAVQWSAFAGKTTSSDELKYKNIPAIPVSVQALKTTTCCKEKWNDLEQEFPLVFDVSDEPITTDILLSENHGFYHIGRVAYIMYMLISDSYISYRMLIRINQFLRVLSFHIDLALRKWLFDHKCNPGLAESSVLIKTWDYGKDGQTSDKVKQAITTMLAECEGDLKELLGISELATEG